MSAYVDLQVDFRSVSMENGEDFFVEYYNGSSWLIVADLISGTNFCADSGFYHADHQHPQGHVRVPDQREAALPLRRERQLGRRIHR